MKQFDKKIRELSRNLEVPKTYDARIMQTLQSLPKEEDAPDGKPAAVVRWRMASVVCVVCLVVVLGCCAVDASAEIYASVKATLMDILHIGEEAEELGVESKKEQVASTPYLELTLQEMVVDAQSMYLMVQLRAPEEVTLTGDISFDYFAFCEGEGYTAESLMGGATDCRYLESVEQSPHTALYLVSLSADMQPVLGKPVTVYFENLTLNPNGDAPDVLVEGKWCLTFVPELTVKKQILLQGTDEMTFPYLGETASVQSIALTPLGLTLTSDVSAVPFDQLGVSDTTITIRLKMIDGSEIAIMPADTEDAWIVDSGSREFAQDEKGSTQKDIFSFTRAIDVAKVTGFYIQDVYVPAE